MAAELYLGQLRIAEELLELLVLVQAAGAPAAQAHFLILA
jgi:hypothetical protein